MTLARYLYLSSLAKISILPGIFASGVLCAALMLPSWASDAIIFVSIIPALPLTFAARLFGIQETEWLLLLPPIFVIGLHTWLIWSWGKPIGHRVPGWRALLLVAAAPVIDLAAIAALMAHAARTIDY